MKFSLITIYGSNVPSNQLSYLGIHAFNERRSFIYVQLHEITSKYNFKSYFMGPDENSRPTACVSDALAN